ncbi:MAG: hypothetical protein ABI333_03125 [bacterium]
MSKRTSRALAVAVMAFALPLALGACGEEQKDYILKDENGNDFSLLFHFWASSEPGSSALFSVGDAGGHFTTDDNETVNFTYALVRRYQLTSGDWLNELDLTVTASESTLFEVGRTYYITIFIYTVAGTDYLNLVIDDSLPYPTSGSPYPSASFPMFREFYD